MGFHQSKVVSEADIKLLEEAIKAAELATDLKRLQAVYFRCAFGMKADQISQLLQYNEKYVKSLWSLYFKEGIDALFSQKKGGRNNAYMSEQEEEIFLQKYAQKSELGQILKIAPLHQGLCELWGVEVPLSTAYRLAHRHGWRKVEPRPHHPKRNP